MAIANFSFSLVLIFVSGLCFAKGEEEIKVEFPLDELPTETVTPAFDTRDAVIGHTLTYSKKIEFYGFVGWLLDDPFYSNQYFGAQGIYHPSEFNGFGLRFQKWQQSLSEYSNQFAASGSPLHLSYAPGPDFAASLLWEHKAYYGKISFGKDSVKALSISFLGELGATKYGSRYFPLIGTGLEQKLFFTRNWAFLLDFRVIAFQSLDPLSVDLHTTATPPNENSFSTKTKLSSQMDIGAVYLF